VLSQRLVAMMGGALTVESELGRGSTMHFEVELPVGARRDLSRELLPIRGLRALVVDDVESSRHVLVEMLASWSVEAVEASSGAEAIALLLPSKTAPQRPFDLVLLDWRMPTMGGLEVVRWIRDRVEEKVLREPPVVVMVTAFDREQLLDEAAGLPLQAVLRKPVSASRLLDTLVGLRGPERLKLSTDPMASVLARAAPLRGAHILVVEDIDTTQLVAEEHGTPLYVYSAGTILDHYHRLDQALSGVSHEVAYAVKANSNLSVLRLLAHEGADVIVSGRVEYFQGNTQIVHPDAIGSLDLAPKHNRVWGDDMTTTRAGKWAAAAGGINLCAPVRSIRRHRQARTRAVV
jgi:CheY-like chemotaxis protein